MDILATYVRKYRKTILAALALAAVNQSFSLMDPQIFRMIIDDYASKAGQMPMGDFMRGVSLLLLATVTVAFVSRTAKAFQDYFVNVSVQRVGTEMYASSVSHAFSLPYSVFEDQRSGELLSKLQKARTDSQAMIASGVNVLFFSLVGMLIVLAYAFYVHWLIGLAYFLIVPVLGTVTYVLGKRIKAAQARIVAEAAALAGSTTETLRNVELVKSLGLEAQEIKRLNDTNDKLLRLELDKVKIVRKLDYIQGTTINALRSALLLLMMWLIARGDISLGQFFSLMFYSFFLFQPLAQLGSVVQSYYEARASLAQLAEVFALKPQESPRDLVAVGPIESIEYRDVGFSYQSSGRETLSGVSLSISPGDTVAFVGPSGSGKSTMVKLLAGLYSPTEGDIYVNGIPSRDIDFDNLRRRIGLVAQETQLFAGTVGENLRFANPLATDEECMEALRLAAATNIIERGDKGLDTRIGEGGLKISGGERQRLAIARALLRDPEVLIFDEATSSLDSLTEAQITETIRSIIATKPSLVTILIAHRLSTVIHADRIFVLERGKIVEHGTHHYLAGKDGLYAALWKQQTAGEAPETAAVSS